MFSMSLDESDYWDWCHEALSDDVKTHCRGVGNSEQELACAKQRLTGAKSYLLREVFTPCDAITDSDVRLACGYEAERAYWKHQKDLIAGWNDVLTMVDTDPKVKGHFNTMVECVESQGKHPPPSGYVLQWQWLGDGPPPEEKRFEKELEWHRTVDSCAHEAGLYETQDTAWIAAIRDLESTSLDKALAMHNAGLVEILEQPGPAPFLYNREFAARQAGR